MQGTAEALVVAVGGGKGGVGKSVVAANLAVALARHGARVIAMDADLGSANLHTLFGIDHPRASLQALIDGRSERLDELAIESGVSGLRLIAGSVALPGAANLQHARKQKLLRHMARLNADVVVIDCGAGVHYNVVDFFAAADLQLLVSSAQLISLQNAYGFLKASLYRTLRQRANEAGRAELLEPTGERSEVETMQKLLERVSSVDAALAEALRGLLQQARVSLLGNQLTDPRELNALHSLSRMIGDFLNVRVPVLGGLCRRDKIHTAVSRRRPFLVEGGSDPESQLLLTLAASLLEQRSFSPLTSEPLQPTAAASSKYQRQRAYARSSPSWPAVHPDEPDSEVSPGVRRGDLDA